MKCRGRVASGAGQGAKFLSLAWVQEALRRDLGLAPFPGTLNLKVPPEVRDAWFAQRTQFLRIADPSAPECPGYLKKVTLRARGRSCDSAYLILPELTMYQDVLEIISPDRLRETLGLHDGDPVEVEMDLN
jgi:riboflavin kinase